MTTKRLGILLAVLLAGLSTVYFLPRQLGYQPMGVSLALPPEIGPWHGHAMEVTQRERDILGHDTEFARMNYTSSQRGSVLVSIVLAGQDMMTGLHRPESCLLAQGWNPGSSARADLTIPDFGPLPVTRLRNTRKIQLQPNTPLVTLDNVCYYWFIGATKLVGSHERRVWTDMFDRVVRGYNQRWAMVLVSGEITAEFERHGRTEEATDEALRDVIARFAPAIVKEGVH